MIERPCERCKDQEAVPKQRYCVDCARFVRKWVKDQVPPDRELHRGARSRFPSNRKGDIAPGRGGFDDPSTGVPEDEDRKEE